MAFMLILLKPVFLLLLFSITIMSPPSFIHNSVFEGINNDLNIHIAGRIKEEKRKIN